MKKASKKAIGKVAKKKEDIKSKKTDNVENVVDNKAIPEKEQKVLTAEQQLLLTEWQKDIESTDPNAIHPYREDPEEMEHAKKVLMRIANDLLAREQPTPVFNNMTYTTNYEYNQLRAQAYSPAKNTKNKNDKNISVGLEHEKVVSFVSILLSKDFKRDITVLEDGHKIKDMGDFLNHGIEHSFINEDMESHLAPLIYYETNSQGDCFVMRDFVVKNINEPNGAMKSKDITLEDLDNMDFDKQTYKTVQVRKIESKILDGRSLIPGNPEIETMQAQPRVTLEFIISREEAQQLFGSLKRWQFVPKTATFLGTVTGNASGLRTLFNTNRIKKPDELVVVHIYMDKSLNLYNVYVNGLQMLNRKTPFTFLYPTNRYPIAKFSTERLPRSFYAKPLPQKIKYNANFFDWVFKMMAVRFERGADPAWVTNGKSSIPKNMFDAGNVTHGIKKGDYERADPEQQGVTPAEINFFNIMKEILESQTINPTVAGQVGGDNTLGEVQMAATAQTIKMAYLFAGIMQGWQEIALISSDIILQRYTQPVEYATVDGKQVPIYNNFSVIHDGSQNVITFQNAMNDPEYELLKDNNQLFQQAYKDKEGGDNINYYKLNPDRLRTGDFNIMCRIIIKDKETPEIKLAKFFQEMGQVRGIFPNVDLNVLQDMYRNIANRPADMFKQMDTGLMQQGNDPSNPLTVPKPNTQGVPVAR